MQSVLITGGSGTLGQALVRRLIAMEIPPERIVVYSRGEHTQEQMAQAIKHPSLRFFIGDVRDYDRLEMALRGIDTIIHAAALKIVPTLEYNPIEAIKTNIYGAENVVQAAIRMGVKQVMGISSDKATSPYNIYGVSKLCAEKLFIAASSLAGDTGTTFSVTRYGNVMGSRGSVIPLFKKIHERGESLPITDERMTRFWITLDQAVDFVLGCISVSTGREIFIPKLPSTRITDIAEAINGNNPPPHIVGIRPGEKLHELMISGDEVNPVWETSNSYIITPMGTKPTDSAVYRQVEQNFVYSSEFNQRWLSVEELKAEIWRDQ